MKTVKPVRISILGILLFMLFFGACSPERKLAVKFVNSGNQKSVLVLAPEFLYKTSLKKEILDSLEIRDESLFDSVLFANSFFLQEIDGKKFIDNYVGGLEKELKVFGFNVFKEDRTAEFMEVDSNAFIINVAQLEVEEAYYPFRDETQYYDNYFYHDHMLNSLAVYSWFEVSPINTEENDRDIYFAQDIIIDEVQGEFTLDIFNSEVKYFYTIDTLKTEELYDFAFVLGRTYAGYTFDLLLNQYLDEQLQRPEEKRYWRYDPNTRTFFTATEDKFIPLEE